MLQWKNTKLGELSDRITKGSTPTTYGYKFLSKGIPFVKIENLANGMIARDSITQYISEEAHQSQKRSQLQAGDVLFSIAGTIGRVAIVTDKDVPANTNQAIAIIRGVTKYFLPDFLKIQLDSHVSFKVKSKARGGAMNNISLDDLKEMDVAVPPFDVQKNIVRVVDTQFTRLDSVIKSLKVIKAKLELYRKAILKTAFEGSLVKFDHTETKSIGDFCEKVRQIKPENESYKDFFYIDIGSIDNKNQKIGSPKIMESRKAPSRARQETFIGDIVYSTVRVYLMNVAIVPDIGDKRIISSTGFTVLRPHEKLNNRFLFYRLISDDVTRYLSGKQRGTSYPAIRDNDLFDMKIVVPSRQIQDKIVQEVELRFSVIDKVKIIVNDSLVKAETLRKSILKSAFEGKLVN